LRLLSDYSVVLEPFAFAERERCVPGKVERKLDREVDSVRLSGVSSDCFDESVLVERPNLVTAVAAECLASENMSRPILRTCG
jgi:hypothetical protein